MLPMMLLSAALAGGADPAVLLDPAQPYTGETSAAVAYKVEFKAVVTAPQGTRKLRVWVPVPPSDAAQEVTDGEWDVFPTAVKPTFHVEPVFGNRFAHFEFADPQGAQVIGHSFRATVRQMDWAVTEANVTAVTAWPKAFDPYRRSEAAILLDDRIRDLAAGVATGKDGGGAKLSAVMDWTAKTMTYDHTATSLVASTAHALDKKRGDCSDYHGLCSSFGRALGVPTRLAYGLHLFPKNLPSHCKLEAYLPPHGWVSFDVSETQRLVGLIEADQSLSAEKKTELTKAATDRLRRGFRDNTWLKHSTGTDYELAPKASRKVPLVSTIHAEADGMPLPTPDPADKTKREFAWMTAHKYETDRPVPYPFRDWRTLAAKPK